MLVFFDGANNIMIIMRADEIKMMEIIMMKIIKMKNNDHHDGESQQGK